MRTMVYSLFWVMQDLYHQPYRQENRGSISPWEPAGIASASAGLFPCKAKRPPLLSRDSLNNTHRLLSSSFLGLPYRILNIHHKKELLRSLWVHIIEYIYIYMYIIYGPVISYTIL